MPPRPRSPRERAQRAARARWGRLRRRPSSPPPPPETASPKTPRSITLTRTSAREAEEGPTPTRFLTKAGTPRHLIESEPESPPPPREPRPVFLRVRDVPTMCVLPGCTGLLIGWHATGVMCRPYSHEFVVRELVEASIRRGGVR